MLDCGAPELINAARIVADCVGRIRFARPLESPCARSSLVVAGAAHVPLDCTVWNLRVGHSPSHGTFRSRP
eukprot:scaffold6883_cov372-Pinguiococcus_pyrenoidosus.AAC.1